MKGSRKYGAGMKVKCLWALGLIMFFLFLLNPAFGAGKALTAKTAAANSVTLTWTAPGDDSTAGTAAQYDLRYSTSNITEANWNAATQVAGEPAPKLAGSPESFEVTGLQPSTTYYFALKAADEVLNWSLLSNVVTKATTAEITPPAAIANLATGAVTSASVVLNWTAPGDDGNVGTASQYDIRYSTATITEANWNAASQVTGEPAPRVAGSAETFTVTGLQPNTTYYFAIKTADEVPNWSAISNVVNGATANESVPPSTIATLSAVGSTITSVTLNWLAPGDDGNVGTASQYDIRYSTATITQANWNAATQVTGEPTPQAAGGTETFAVTGLQPSTTYYFAIKTADEVPNWSAISNIASRATAAEQVPPAAVTNFAAGAVTTSSVVLSWTAPGDDGNTGTASQYDIRYSTSTITEANWGSVAQATSEPTPKIAGSAETFTLTGLLPNTTYYYAIKTADEVPNWSALSNVVSKATANETIPPTGIANLTAGTATANTVVLNWTAPGDDGSTGTAAQYDIRYSTATITDANWASATQVTGEPAPKVAGSAETFTVTGLNNGTTYYFAVKTADEVPNWSVLSNVVTKATLDQIPPSPINDLTAAPGAQMGEILLSWTATGEDSTIGFAESYDLRYSLDSITEAVWYAATSYNDVPAPLSGGNIESLTMSGLVPGQLYHIGLKAKDHESNFSEISNVVSSVARFDFATGDTDNVAQPVSPAAGAAVRLSHPTLVVANIDTLNPNLYQFEVALDSEFAGLVAASLPVTQEEGPTTSWKVTEKLRSNQIYYWRAKVNDLAYGEVSFFSIKPAVHTYPNPFKINETENVTFTEIPEGSNLTLMSVSGATVRQWSNLPAADLTWDGTNDSGSKVASGTYLWYLEGSDIGGKLVLIH
ncbi:MAG: fibronectin type III domain-containing protein [candidate division Zixibacteria bacterium]|nr:fibronectin type III domain-containing protein [candidate division Zixibacteria bacterium]